MLDCGAHMLLYLDQPLMGQRIGLQHLLERFAAARVDLGFGTSSDPKYQACAVETQQIAISRTCRASPGQIGLAPFKPFGNPKARSISMFAAIRLWVNCGRYWNTSKPA
jgi:hypothetical protein